MSTTELQVEVRVTVYGHSGAWSIEPSAYPDATANVRVTLSIQSDGQSGYHFVMSPDGYFTADTYHLTLDEAFEAGREFGVEPEAWHSVEKPT